MARLRNPTGATKEVLKVVESPKLKEENKKLKEELSVTKSELMAANDKLSEMKSQSIKAQDELVNFRVSSVPMKTHQELVDRHNEVLKEYGKLRMDVMKGSPVNQQMKAAEIKEKIVEKEVFRDVIRIRQVLDRKKAAVISFIASAAGLIAGALIF